jgi:hypothetical protein
MRHDTTAVSSRLAFFSVSAGRCTYCLGFGLLLTNFCCWSCLEAAALPTPTSHRNRSHIAGTSCHERTTPRASTASPVSHPSPLADDVQHATLRALALLSSQFLGSCLAVSDPSQTGCVTGTVRVAILICCTHTPLAGFLLQGPHASRETGPLTNRLGGQASRWA